MREVKRRRLRQVPLDWWAKTEKTATHRNVNKWPQLRARVTLSICLLGLAFTVYALVVVAAIVAVVVALPLSLWAQGDRIVWMWSTTKRKEPVCVR